MKRTKRLLRITIPIVAIICTVVFTPWEVLSMWAAPLPDTLLEQVDIAVGHNLDDIIVYVDKKGERLNFTRPAGKIKRIKSPRSIRLITNYDNSEIRQSIFIRLLRLTLDIRLVAPRF